MTDDKDSMTKAEDAEGAKTKSSSFNLFGARELISYALAAAITGVATWFAIGRRHGTNFEELKAHGSKEVVSEAQEIRRRHDIDLVKLHEDRGKWGPNFAKEQGKLFREQQKEIGQYWEKRGIKGWRKFHMQLQSMKGHQSWEVAFNSSAIMFVTLGAIVGLAHRKEVVSFVDRVIHGKEQQQAQAKEAQRG